MTSFEEQRPKLFGIAYRMVGSAMDAEDIVQDAWLRYQQCVIIPDNPSAYLRKIVTNLSLDYLKSARVQREQYVGEWLPEPIVTDGQTPSNALSRAEHISVAFLIVLEQLSPLERAVFILREVFDYDYAEIARLLDKSPPACRQVFSRAKKHIHARRPRYAAAPDTHNRLVREFITALQTGNIGALTDLLATDASLHSDGGGKVPAATRPLHGQKVILKFLVGLRKRAQVLQMDYSLESMMLNGELGLIGRETATGQIFMAATFELGEEKIAVLRFVRNPDKLKQLQDQ